MPTLRIEQSEKKVKVAVVFEPDMKIRPVWFEVLGKERVQVGEICGVWYHTQGVREDHQFRCLGWAGEMPAGVQHAVVLERRL